MSVVPNDLVVYGSANMPEADGVTIGGAVDFTKRIAFFDPPATGLLAIASSSTSDTAVKMSYAVRDATGAIQTVSAVTLTGQTAAVGSQNCERLLYACITGGAIGALTNPGGTGAVGDIVLGANANVLPAGANMNDATVRTAQVGSANTTGTTPPLFKLQAGDGSSVSPGHIIWTRGGTGPQQLRMIIATSGYGTDVVAVSRDWTVVPDATTTYKVLSGMLFEILPNPVKAITRLFATAASDIPGGSTRIYYEKVFVVNNNTATALTSAQIQDAANTPTLPGSALLDLALTNALNDTGTVANRQTVPGSGITAFSTQPAFVNVPAPGNLPSGSAPNAAGAEGVWLRLTLPAGTTAYDGSADLRTQGSTT
jgi:hypothetical protein